MDADLKTLAMVSPDEGWVAGSKEQGVTEGNIRVINEGGAVLHYQAGHWIEVKIPGDAEIKQLSMVSSDEGWALTFEGLLHYHEGVWEQFSE